MLHRVITLTLLACLCLFPLSPALAGEAGDAAPPKSGRHRDHTDRLIIRFKDKSVARARTLSRARMNALRGAAGVGLAHVRPMSGDAHVLKLPKRMTLGEAKAVAERLRMDPDVEYAEPDRRMFAMTAPDDPSYADQWHYQSPDAPDDEIAGVNLPGAWDLTTGSDGIVVAVLDTGIVAHADLEDRTVPGYNFISDPAMAGNGFGRGADPSDPGDWTVAEECGAGSPAENSSWHGTHVAGTIGAAANNGLGVSGVNWTSKILPVRVLGKCGGYTSDIIDGMRWAAGLPVAGAPANANPAKVLNLSLGGEGACSASEQEAVNDVTAAGAVVVVAAGNDSGDAANYSPAGCSGVITVAAVNRAGGMAYYSNYGPAVAIASPGGEFFSGVLSTSNTGTAAPEGDAYHYQQGTSSAAPHVSGIASLMLSANPALTPAQVLEALRATARAFPVGTGSDAGDCIAAKCGAGLVDALRAVREARDLAQAPAADPATPVITWSNPASITYGTPLGGTQLNATSEVPGAFVYDPPPGAVLDAGAGHLLSATFTPNDATRYTTAAASVHLEVLKAGPGFAFTGLSQTYDGTGKAVAVSTVPAGLAVLLSYDPSPPVRAGVYAVTAEVSDGNYEGVRTTTMEINPRPLTVSATGVNKAYDGTAGATVVYGDDRIAGDVFTISGTAAFADGRIGANKTVAVTGIGISGPDAANYSLASSAASAAADIIGPDGDFDGGGVSVTDALRALRMAAGILTPTTTDFARGDVAPLVGGIPRPDGAIDIGDALVILRKAVGLVSW